MTKACRSEDAILQAAFDLVAEHGVSGVTVDAVAARAGVGKQTIYRHWGSRAGLIHSAVSCMTVEEEVPDTGSVRGDLVLMLQQLVEFLGRSDAGRVLPSLVDAAERDPELYQLRRVHIAKRRATFEHVLRRAVERGEVDAGTDLDLLIDLLVGPFFYKRLVSQGEVTRVDVDQVLDLVLRAVGASKGVDA
jgi:AcrR family transcriptional regulator